MNNGENLPRRIESSRPDTEEFVVAELSISELNKRVGEPDPITGRPPTLLETMQRDAESQGWRTWTHIGQHLSEGARRVNKSVRDNRLATSAGATVMAVIVAKKIIDHRKDK